MATSKVLVRDIGSKEVLFECPIEEAQKAYAYASDMEEMGLDVEVISPTITETLTDSLGMNHDQKEEYENSVIAEIKDHDGGCCASES